MFYQCSGKCNLVNKCKFSYVLPNPEDHCYHKKIHMITSVCKKYPECIKVEEFITKEDMEIK